MIVKLKGREGKGGIRPGLTALARLISHSPLLCTLPTCTPKTPGVVSVPFLTNVSSSPGLHSSSGLAPVLQFSKLKLF